MSIKVLSITSTVIERFVVFWAFDLVVTSPSVQFISSMVFTNIKIKKIYWGKNKQATPLLSNPGWFKYFPENKANILEVLLILSLPTHN